MKFYKKALALVLSTMLLGSVMVGCGTSASSATQGEDAIIKMAQSTDVISFDPHNHNDVSSSNVTRHVFSNLVKLTTDGEFVGDLAEGWEFLDDLNVKFTLKPDVKFHNGDVLTAEDVKFSLERQKKSSKVGHLVKMIDSVEVVDDLNVIIHMNEPSSALISSLAHSGGAILNKKVVEELDATGKTMDSNMVGTGPYKFEAWNPGDSVSLVRNDEYFGEKPANGGLQIRVITEESSRTIALETGEIDVVLDVASTDAKRIRDNSELELVEYESTQVEFLVMNTQKAPFDNPLVRKAINHAVDKDSIITVAVNGEATPQASYLGDGAIGYSSDVTVYDYDLEKAKALLAEAGYANGFECSVYVASDTRSRAAQVLQASLAQIGVTLRIEQMDSGVFYDKTGTGEHDMALTGWVANAEPDNTFRPLFHSSNIGSGGNRSFYVNDTVDALIDEAAITQEMDKRLENYAEVLRVVTDDAIFAPFYTKKGLVAKRDNVDGIEVYPINMHRFENIHFVQE